MGLRRMFPENPLGGFRSSGSYGIIQKVPRLGCNQTGAMPTPIS